MGRVFSARPPARLSRESGQWKEPLGDCTPALPLGCGQSGAEGTDANSTSVHDTCPSGNNVSNCSLSYWPTLCLLQPVVPNK